MPAHTKGGRAGETRHPPQAEALGRSAGTASVGHRHGCPSLDADQATAERVGGLGRGRGASSEAGWPRDARPAHRLPHTERDTLDRVLWAADGGCGRAARGCIVARGAERSAAGKSGTEPRIRVSGSAAKRTTCWLRVVERGGWGELYQQTDEAALWAGGWVKDEQMDEAALWAGGRVKDEQMVKATLWAGGRVKDEQMDEATHWAGGWVKDEQMDEATHGAGGRVKDEQMDEATGRGLPVDCGSTVTRRAADTEPKGRCRQIVASRCGSVHGHPREGGRASRCTPRRVAALPRV